MGEPTVPQSQSEADALVRFYDTLTTHLDNKDGNHLICAGGFNHMSQNQQYNWWQNIFALIVEDRKARQLWHYEPTLFPSRTHCIAWSIISVEFLNCSFSLMRRRKE